MDSVPTVITSHLWAQATVRVRLTEDPSDVDAEALSWTVLGKRAFRRAVIHESLRLSSGLLATAVPYRTKQAPTWLTRRAGRPWSGG